MRKLETTLGFFWVQWPKGIVHFALSDLPSLFRQFRTILAFPHRFWFPGSLSSSKIPMGFCPGFFALVAPSTSLFLQMLYLFFSWVYTCTESCCFHTIPSRIKVFIPAELSHSILHPPKPPQKTRNSTNPGQGICKNAFHNFSTPPTNPLGEFLMFQTAESTLQWFHFSRGCAERLSPVKICNIYCP